MPDYPNHRTSLVNGGHAALRTAGVPVIPEPSPATATPRHAAFDPVEQGDDPVTDWLLQREDLDTTEFGVLFAIHKLRARRHAVGWIGYADLRRCTGLAPDAIGRVLTVLRQRGLIWMAPHPVKTGYARYMLLVQ